jgi:hypothetical protein
MGFLAPWLLALGGAALVPLLIHLLRRRIGMQVEFPAARYLARAEREHSRTMRMRNLLLMLFRVIAVLLLAMAAAKPIGRYVTAGAGHAPTALAIVIDNSMSTSMVEGGSSLLEQFKQTARDAIDRATPDDRLWLVTVDGALRGGNASSMRDELERIRPYAGAGNLREAIARAAAAVDGSGLVARQVAVLTDGQRTALTEAAQLRGNTPVLAWAPAQSPAVNRAVVAAEARPVRWTPRGAVSLRVQSPDSAIYRIALGLRTLARGGVAPAEEASIRAAPAERGWVAGTVEIEPDELVLDNTRHFAVWIGPAPAVTVSAGAGVFLRNAVDVLRSSERVREGTDITIASADEVGRLPALIVPPSDPVRIGAANRTLERLGIPWRFGAPRRESAIARGDQLSSVSVTLRYALDARGAPVADTLAVVGPEPWIVSGRGYVLLGSPVDAAATSLPITATFLPWLGDVLASRLHGDPGVLRATTPGQRVSVPAGVEAIEGTDGRRIPVTGSAVEAPGVAGTYFLIQGTRRAGALVVNPEVEESRLERWSAEELPNRLASRGARVVESRAAWVDRAFAGAARQSLVGPLLLALLLVLAAEMVAATMGAPSTK